MKKSILIIGGMGPQASLLLHQYLIEAAVMQGAVDNQDYPLVVHLSIPVPDFISDPHAKKAALSMIETLLQPLKDMQFTDAVIACNTAHLLYDEITEVLGFRPHSLLQLVAEEAETQKGQRPVGLLATPITIASRLYENATVLDEPGRRATLSLILGVLAGKAGGDIALDELIKRLKQKGCGKVILGCTELSVLNQGKTRTDVIDPLKLVARKIMGIAV